MSKITSIDQTEDNVYDQFYAQEERLGAIEQLKLQIEVSEKQEKKANAFLKLEKNEDFQLVIEKGFIEDLGKSAIKALGRNPDEQHKEDMHNVILAIGILQAHFEGIAQLGARAKLELPRLRDELIRLQSLN